MLIVSLTGFRNSGKNTFSLFLKERGFVEISFAETLKDVLSILFLWDRKMLDGITELSRRERKKVDEWWSEKLNIKDFSPEKALTLLGTELFRNCFNENIWIFSLERKLLKIFEKNPDSKIVVTDCRFTNEINFLNKFTENFVSVKIVREQSEPFWKEKALKAKSGCVESLNFLKEKNVHLSEWDLIDYCFDFVVYNNGSKEDLKSECERFLNFLQNKKLI